MNATFTWDTESKLEGLTEVWQPREGLATPPEEEGGAKTDVDKLKDRLVLFSANSSPSCMELANRIAERLGVELGKTEVYQDSSGETRIQIQESVRGKDVYVIQTISPDVNRCLVELCVMAYGCVTAGARSVCGVLPYLPYSRQCKMRKRGSIVCQLMASLMCCAGLTHLITMDLHQKEIQGFFNIPVDNLRASPFLLQYIKEEIPDYSNAVIVAKSPASAKRAQSLAERLRVCIAVIHGDAETDLLDGRHSPPTVRTSGGLPQVPFCIPKEKRPIAVVGDVVGRVAIIVDDIIDDAVGFVAAAEILRERGAGPIIAMATHAILSADAPRILQESAISQVVVTNTIPHSSQKLQCCKIKTVDVSLILSEAVWRIHCGESMSYLFHNIGADD